MDTNESTPQQAVGGMRRAVSTIRAAASAWRQPTLTEEPDSSRLRTALGMIHRIAEWALHPAHGDEPPFVERPDRPCGE